MNFNLEPILDYPTTNWPLWTHSKTNKQNNTFNPSNTDANIQTFEIVVKDMKNHNVLQKHTTKWLPQRKSNVNF